MWYSRPMYKDGYIFICNHLQMALLRAYNKIQKYVHTIHLCIVYNSTYM